MTDNARRLAELEVGSDERQQRLYMAALHRISELEQELAAHRQCILNLLLEDDSRDDG